MSGGFFRGTSASQDTRFSNKQAKLLKSQKFAPELEHLVDMTKVKMDVMRPWIATRVTELIGFEDEVLINFIYGLLDGKEVNGKEVQIALTGFMERNTGKFMKELWSLLLSAQENASGVPQQFLDAKEEETKKKKAESDRIANEIQRKKEKESQELEEGRTKKMDRGDHILKDVDTGMQPSLKYQPRVKSAVENESEERNELRERSRVYRSPHSADRSSSPSGRGRRSRSNSKSFSNSRSYSDKIRRSRSVSVSSKQRGRSSSSEMVQRYSPRHSLTPHRRHSFRRSFSPRHKSSYSRRRSVSRSHRRSPSLTRYRTRSPLRRRSRSPLRCRSRSPIWRRPRSPARRSSPRDRSRSPVQHRSSSVRRRSPSPMRYRSPSPMRWRYRRSPSTSRRRSPPPIRRRSPSPIRRRSPSPIRRRSRSPIRHRSSSPIHHLPSSPIGRRSPIAGRRRSPSPANHKFSLSQVSSSSSPRRQRRSPLQSFSGRIRNHEKYSPVRHAAPSDMVEHPTTAHQRSNSSEHRSRSDSWDRNDSHRKVKRSSLSPYRSPVVEAERGKSLIEKRREKIPRSGSPNPQTKARENKNHDDNSSEISADDIETKEFRDAPNRKHHSSAKISSVDQRKGSHGEGHSKDGFASEKNLVQSPSRLDRIESNKTDQMLQRGNKSEKIDHQKIPGQEDLQIGRDTLCSEKGKESPTRERDRAVEKFNDQHCETVLKLSKKVDQSDQNASVGSDSEESDKSRGKIEDKRKKKGAERPGLESADESSYDSYAEERKEAKRRRKEEKRLKKEERRRRRKERRHRKEERRAEKQRLKSIDTTTSPSETDGNHDGRSDNDDQYVQKKLEIELRERALESLRAKKGIGH